MAGVTPQKFRRTVLSTLDSGRGGARGGEAVHAQEQRERVRSKNSKNVRRALPVPQNKFHKHQEAQARLRDLLQGALPQQQTQKVPSRHVVPPLQAPQTSAQGDQGGEVQVCLLSTA